MPEENKQQEQVKKGEAPTAVGKSKKRTKINRMTLQEVDKKLEEVKEKMGSLSSKYAMELLKRKKELAGS